LKTETDFLRINTILFQSPSYKNFKGTIEKVDSNKFAISGEIAYLDENTLEITELPIKTWTQVNSFCFSKTCMIKNLNFMLHVVN